MLQIRQMVAGVQAGLASELYQSIQGIGGFLRFQTVAVVSRFWVKAGFDDP